MPPPRLAGVGVKITLVPAQILVVPETATGFEAMLTVGVPLFVINKLLPLSDPKTEGALLTTLIRYTLPVTVVIGIVTLILWLPLASDTTFCKM